MLFRETFLFTKGNGYVNPVQKQAAYQYTLPNHCIFDSCLWPAAVGQTGIRVNEHTSPGILPFCEP